jgi:hypothetical protein
MNRGQLTFSPVLADDATRFKTFWSTGTAWGTYTLHRSTPADAWQSTIEVLGGDLNGIDVTFTG